MTLLAFLDTETTGLRADYHEIWEVGLVLHDTATLAETEHHWFLPVDLAKADPFALEIGRFHQRHPRGYNFDLSAPGHVDAEVAYSNIANAEHGLSYWCREFAELTQGAHLVGAVISFDEERLRRLLLENHVIPAWHYHVIDVEALAVGYLQAKGHTVPLPWKSDDLTTMLGIDNEQFEKHTALGDVGWAKAIYDACS